MKEYPHLSFSIQRMLIAFAVLGIALAVFRSYGHLGIGLAVIAALPWVFIVLVAARNEVYPIVAAAILALLVAVVLMQSLTEGRIDERAMAFHGLTGAVLGWFTLRMLRDRRAPTRPGEAVRHENLVGRRCEVAERGGADPITIPSDER